MMKKFLSGIVLIGALAFAQHGFAQDTTPPDALVKTVSQEVIGIIKADRSIQSGNTRKVVELVEEKILPHFDFQRMTALAMGANWRKATPEQQKQLVDQFRALLVHTYSSGLAAYRDQVIDFKPLRAKPEDTEVIVRSEVRQSGAQPIPIDYSMQKTAQDWKVYDVVIGGVSLVTTYRDSFATEVRNGGIDGLIKTLADKNKSLQAGKR